MLSQVYEMMTKLGCWSSDSQLLVEHKVMENGLLFEAMALDDVWQKYYSNIKRDVFDKCIQSDPTYNAEKPNKMGKYGKWILSLYLKGVLKIEDLYKVSEYLSVFIKYFNRMETKDINQFKSIQDLYKAVSPFIGGTESTSKSDEVRKIKEGAEKVYEDDEWLVVVPHTKEASIYYGKGTQWCTASEHSHNMFNSYNSKGLLYININKYTNEKYQFHIETASYMDETDSPINPYDIGLTSGLLEFYDSQTKITRFKNGITVICGLGGGQVQAPNTVSSPIYLEDSYTDWGEWGNWVSGYCDTYVEGGLNVMLVNTEGDTKYCSYDEDIQSSEQLYIAHSDAWEPFVAFKNGYYLDAESINKVGKGLIVTYRSYQGRTMNLVSPNGELLLDEDGPQYKISMRHFSKTKQVSLVDVIMVENTWNDTIMLYDTNFQKITENWMDEGEFNQFCQKNMQLEPLF